MESIVVKLTILDIVVYTMSLLAESIVITIASGSSVLNYFLSLNIVTAQLES